MPRFYPPASLAEHCLLWHGFPDGKTVTPQVHLADHAAHERAVDWLAGGEFGWGRLSAVMPIGHPYQVIEQEVQAA